MTLREANLPLQWNRQAWNPTNEYMQRITKGARFEETNDNRMTLVLENEELRQDILDYLKGPMQQEDPQLLNGALPQELLTNKGLLQQGDNFQPDESSQEGFLDGRNSQFSDVDPKSASATEHGTSIATNPEKVEVTETPLERDHLPDKSEVSEPLSKEEDPLPYEPADGSWRRISLADPEFKFAVSFAPFFTNIVLLTSW